jgi:hypothetical protein
MVASKVDERPAGYWGEQTHFADWVSDSLSCHTVDSKGFDLVPKAGPRGLLFAAFDGSAKDGIASHLYVEHYNRLSLSHFISPVYDYFCTDRCADSEAFKHQPTNSWSLHRSNDEGF